MKMTFKEFVIGIIGAVIGSIIFSIISSIWVSAYKDISAVDALVFIYNYKLPVKYLGLGIIIYTFILYIFFRRKKTLIRTRVITPQKSDYWDRKNR